MRHFLLLLVAIAACNTTIEDVCENVADCAHGGSTDWVQECQAATGGLETEAKNAGCGDAFDAYYECAKSKFTCNGNVASFPGCDRAPLDTCLSKARAGSSCAELARDCGDAGVSSCTAAQSCTASCYLRIVKNPCAPTPEELDGVAVCTSACPQ